MTTVKTTEKKTVATAVKAIVVKSTGDVKSTGKLAVVLVRGPAKTFAKIQDALQMLRLNRKNHCVVIPDTPPLRGMINMVKDYVTWGEISDETFLQLLKVRGREYKGRLTDAHKKYDYTVLTVNGKKYKPYFALNPPRKGFGRKGIKVAFAASGALGYRAEAINDLLVRMM